MATEITSLTPDEVTITVGETLTVEGTDLSSNNPQISIEGVALTTTYVSATELSVVWEAFLLPVGVYDVDYADSDGNTFTLVGAFTVSAGGTMPANVVDIGTSPDDGTGDVLRVAFAKLNNVIKYIDSLLPAAGPFQFTEAAADVPAADPTDTTKVVLYHGTTNNTWYVWSPDSETWYPLITV